MAMVRTPSELRTAIHRDPIDALDVTWEPDAVSAAHTALEASGLLLLGECHGVAENAAAIRALVPRIGIGAVALEWPSQLEPIVKRFIEDGRLTDDPGLWLGDGRVTVEHFPLLRQLAGAGVAVGLVDDRVARPGSSWTELDRRLADSVLARTHPSQRTLVVCGNAHTPTQPTTLGVPMGAWIARARPGAREIRIEYGAGEYFNLGSRTFTPGAAADRPARLRVVAGELRLQIGRAHEATVPVAGGLSPSTDDR